ncbi:MAG: LamG domain-containing protein, partial [Nanoarchaeota archaeon]|nr:LamG domain-containing protein [Nanoarchaeota archaeon]
SVIAHFTVTGLTTNNFDWSCRACDATDCYFADVNRTLHVDVTNPDIEFVAPTQTNNTKVATFDNFNYVNVSVSDISNNYSAFIDWNRSLVGWWRLEDEGGTSFSDSSTWNNQGSCSGIACPNLTTGMRGKAYKFDGVDDVVTIPAFNLGDIPSITFSAWIKLHNASISSLQGIIYKSSTVMDFYITNTGKLNVYLTNDVAWHSTALTSTYTDWNDWHHVVAIYNGSAVIIYRDGQQVAIDNIGESGDIPASNGIAIIGKNSGGAFTNGSIDEVMIWNRALSPEEINASYNANIWKLYHNFTSLSPGTYTYKAYVVDQAGNLNNTEQRTFIVNSEPTVTSAILNSTYGTNLTTENLTAYVTYNDNDSDAVTLVYDWRKDGISDAVLNMPFDVNGSNENYLNVKDYSTFGKNGTLINATWNTSCGAFADSGGCYEFRSNGWIVTPIIANYSQWTLSTWINPAVPISDAAPIYGIYAIFSGSNTTNFLGISNSALRMYTTTIASYDFTNNPGWHNVVYSFNGTLLTGYVDVTNTDSITLLQNPLRGDIVRYIAARTTANTHTFNGSIDQLMFWNRTLSSAEIAMLYNNGAGMYNRTHSDATSKGDTWYAVVTPVDAYEEGESVASNNVTIETSVATVTLTSPQDRWYVNSTAKFECLATSSIPITSVSLYHNNTGTWQANSTITSSATSVIAHFTVTGLTVNNFEWSCRACDATDCYFASINRTLYVDITNPDIAFVNPTQTNNTKVATFNNFNYVNVSVTDASNNYSAFIDWNRSLVGWWRLEDEGGSSFSDSSTWGNNGTCSGTACPNLTTGMRGKAYKFDGIDDYVAINSSPLNINADNSYSISLWTKIKGSTGTTMSLWEGDTLSAPSLESNGGTTNFFYYIYNGAGYSYIQTGTLTADIWYHIVAVYDESAYKQELFVNGVSKGSNSLNVNDSINSLYIGARGGRTLRFNGSIDEVQVWNRALSSEEINASYSAGIYKLYRNFTSLNPGTYTYKAYVVDQAGNLNTTEQRTFIVNSEPTVTSAILNSTLGTNLTTENLTVYAQYNDNDSDTVTLVYDFRKNGISDAVLNMPFDVNGSNGNTSNVKDYSTWGNNGTLGNEPRFNSSCNAFSGSGGCYEFDGINDFISRNPFINGSSASSFTVWAKADLMPSNGAPVYRLLNTEGTGYAGLIFIEDINFIYCMFENRNYTYSTAGISFDDSTDNVWHLWGCTIDLNGDGKARLYKDGILVQTSGIPITGYLDTRGTSYYIGGDGGDRIWNGSIDQVQIWNRSLSASEISMLYNYGYNRTHSDATSKGDTWYAVVTPVDTYEEGEPVASNNVTIETSIATVTLTDPQDGWYVNSTAKFECLATSSIPITSVSLYHNNTETWEANSTITSSATSVIAHFTVTGLATNNFDWSCRACDATDCYFASINRTLHVDVTNPDIEFVNPTQTNNTKVSTFNNFNYVNVSVSDASNNYSAFIDWNRSLVGYWRLENTNGTWFEDSSTYGNNGTCSSS